MPISHALKTMMEEHDLQRDQLAKLSGVPYATIDSMLRRTESTRGDLHILHKLVQVCGEDLEILLDDPNYKKKVVLDESEEQLLRAYHQLTTEQQAMVVRVVRNPSLLLNDEEIKLVDAFRKLNETGKQAANSMILGLSLTQK